jgi:site-specific DNA recombinase
VRSNSSWSKRAIRSRLLTPAIKNTGNRPGRPDDDLRDEVFVLAIKARVKRCGSEVRLILAGADDNQQTRVVPSMIKALARAHRWYEGIVHGESTGGRSIAKQTGFDERYVSLIIRCAFLAPDITAAILDGRQPPSFTLAKITSSLPMDWADQRRLLGFTTARALRE